MTRRYAQRILPSDAVARIEATVVGNGGEVYGRPDLISAAGLTPSQGSRAIARWLVTAPAHDGVPISQRRGPRPGRYAKEVDLDRVDDTALTNARLSYKIHLKAWAALQKGYERADAAKYADPNRFAEARVRRDAAVDSLQRIERTIVTLAAGLGVPRRAVERWFAGVPEDVRR